MGVFKSGWTQATVARNTAGSEIKVNDRQKKKKMTGRASLKNVEGKMF